MKLIAIPVSIICVAFFSTNASAATPTATYSNSNQTLTLTGLGGSGGVGQVRPSWGTCAYDGTHTNCTITAPYTGVGGGGTISMILTYLGNGVTPFLLNSISPGSNLVSFGPFIPGMSITVTLMENTGATVSFLTTSTAIPNFNFNYTNGTCTGIASSSCNVGQVGLTPGATITGTISGSFDDTPVINSVISASSYGGFPALAPGTWMEIYGLNLANLANVSSQTWTTANFNGNAAPTALGGTTVTIGGQSAFIDYVSPGQVNAQVPSNIATGPEQVVVTSPGGTSAAYTITVNATEPGLLAPSVFDLPAGQYIGATFPNGATFVLPPGVASGVPTARAVPGDVIIFYGVGFGTVTPNIPAGQIVTQTNQLSGFQVSFAGVPAVVQFAGLTAGYLGLYQFNVVVPNVAASDTVPVTFSLGGTTGTQKLIIPVGN